MQTSRVGVDQKRIEPLELVAVKNLVQLRLIHTQTMCITYMSSEEATP